MKLGLHLSPPSTALTGHWPPAGSSLALDFVEQRYALAGVPVSSPTEIFNATSTPLRFSGTGHPDGAGLLCEAGDEYFIDLGSWFEATGSTIIIDTSVPDDGINQDICDIHNANDVWAEKWISRWNVNTWQAVIRHLNTASGNIQAGAHARPARFATSFGDGFLGLAINGTLIDEVSTTLPTGLSRMRLGATHNGGNALGGVIRQFVAYPETFAADDLRALSRMS